MEREIITIDEYGRLSVPANTENVWMSEAELVELFGVICPTIRAAIKAIYNSGVLQKFAAERYDQISRGCSVIRYNLQMIIALAFRIDSFGALKIREHVCCNFRMVNRQPIVNVLIGEKYTVGKNYFC